MVSISTAAPQFLVDRLEDALAFYEQRLGFDRDFVYVLPSSSHSTGGPGASAISTSRIRTATSSASRNPPDALLAVGRGPQPLEDRQ